MTLYTVIDSPLGPLLAAGDGVALTDLYLPSGRHPKHPEPSWQRADRPFAALREQLAEYFAGARREFDLALAPRGTAFQQQVWQQLRAIPYGTTTSYGRIAGALGTPHASRAVGLANGRNPISIVVPCHRVIGADGSLTGYGGGLAAKRWLLDHERGLAQLL